MDHLADIYKEQEESAWAHYLSVKRLGLKEETEQARLAWLPLWEALEMAVPKGAWECA